MKTILTLAVLLASANAFAETSSFGVKCSGMSADGKSNIEAITNEDRDLLNITITPVGSKSEASDAHSLKITHSANMFPIASLDASRDQRPVDGMLVEAGLTISNMEASEKNRAATLVITSKWWSRMNRGESQKSESYQIHCLVQR